MRFIASLALLTVCLGVTERASAADVSAVVLGLRSLEGDDDFANSMTEALRGAARSVKGWRLLERAVSMSQMALAHSCDEIDASCLSEIAKGLEADRVIFGTVRRTAARTKYDFEITVSVFNGVNHSISGTETQIVARADSKNKKALSTRADGLIEKLAAADVGNGRLLVEVNVLSAEVRLDGQVVGQTQDGKLTLDTVSPGSHSLEVSAPGHQTQTQQINVNGGDQNTIGVTLERIPEPTEVAAAPPEATPAEAQPPAAEGGSSLSWVGYTLLGVGAASALAWGASMYILEFQYNRDPTYQSYKNAYYNQANKQIDACDEALAGHSATLSKGDLSTFQSQCRTARTFQTLQWVFLGAAVVASGVGAYVLISESGSKSDQQARARAPRLALQPMFDRKQLAVQATLRF
jgi:hypothetical protein